MKWCAILCMDQCTLLSIAWAAIPKNRECLLQLGALFKLRPPCMEAKSCLSHPVMTAGEAGADRE